jgi:hypothetical protein
MKHFWILPLLAGLVLAGGEKQSFEDRFWSEFFRSTPTLVNDSLVRMFMAAPDFFPIVDSSGRFQENGTAKYVEPDQSRGILYVIHRKIKVAAEHNGNPRPVKEIDAAYFWYQIEEIIVFDLTKQEKK